jgi:hypothetical protein
MPSVDFRAVRERCSISAVLTACGVHWTRDPGGQIRCHCPIHGGRSGPRGTWSGSETRWTCHKCARKGDVADLVALVCHLPLYAAAIEACRMCNVAVPLIRTERGPACTPGGNGVEAR